MMTFYVAWKLMERFYPESTTIDVTIKRECTKVIGTRAKLKTGDTLSLIQIFYGLLLPSGNDAALVLADFFGEKLAS
jgi:serine-type D-Ala-D-Ala carboxypeptidase (penicillin-binding protein 5/6)